MTVWNVRIKHSNDSFKWLLYWIAIAIIQCLKNIKFDNIILQLLLSDEISFVLFLWLSLLIIDDESIFYNKSLTFLCGLKNHTSIKQDDNSDVINNEVKESKMKNKYDYDYLYQDIKNTIDKKIEKIESAVVSGNIFEQKLQEKELRQITNRLLKALHKSQNNNKNNRMYLSTASMAQSMLPEMDNGVEYSRPIQMTDRNRKKLFFDKSHPLSNALLLRQCIPE